MNTNYHLRLFYDSSTDAALISGAAQVVGSGINAISVAKSSKADREFMKEMYDKQRADALADRDYALPVNQMARLKAGGLNPNLVYGSGIGQAPAIRGASFVPYHRTPPDIGSGIANAASAFYGTKIQVSQLNNMEAQNQVLLADKNLKDAQAKATLAGIPKTQADTTKILAETTLIQFNTELAKSTRESVIAIKSGEAEKIGAETQYILDNNQRQAISNVVSVREGLTKILNMDAERANTIAEKQAIYEKINSIRKSNDLKQLDIDYIKNTNNTGRPGDSGLVKLITKIYGDLTNPRVKDNRTPEQALKELPKNNNGYIIPDTNQ